MTPLFVCRQYFREEDPMSQEKLNRHFEKIVPILDDLIRSMPDLVRIEAVLGRLGEIHCSEGIKPNLLDVMGPVFCNTVRPLLLVQGQWSYQVGDRLLRRVGKFRAFCSDQEILIAWLTLT